MSQSCFFGGVFLKDNEELSTETQQENLARLVLFTPELVQKRKAERNAGSRMRRAAWQCGPVIDGCRENRGHEQCLF